MICLECDETCEFLLLSSVVWCGVVTDSTIAKIRHNPTIYTVGASEDETRRQPDEFGEMQASTAALSQTHPLSVPTII